MEVEGRLKRSAATKSPNGQTGKQLRVNIFCEQEKGYKGSHKYMHEYVFTFFTYVEIIN